MSNILNRLCLALACITTLSQASFGQSSDQNYVHSRVPRRAIQTEAKLNTLTPVKDSVEQTISYFDGLGRPLQTIGVRASAGGADVVQPIAYDGYGREATKYLPYATGTTNSGLYRADALNAGAGVSNYYNPAGGTGPQQTNGVVRTAYPFAQTVFEPSALNRPVEQGAAGDAWQPLSGSIAASGHTIKMVYASNNIVALTDTANSRLVAYYTISVINPVSQQRTLARAAGNAGIYNANELYVTISKDENWTSGRGGTTEEYKDKEGHVVLKRTFNWKALPAPAKLEVLSTYYVYDDFGNLAYVLPPLSNADNALPTQTILNNLCYQYRYDERNRLTQKKLPGKGWEYTVYNMLNQPVLSQDSLQRVTNQWTVTKYDALGRVIVTGLCNFGSVVMPLATLQTEVYTHTQWDTRDATNALTGYTNVCYPSNIVNLSINYYDDYVNIPGLPAGYRPTAGSYSSRTMGLPTAAKVAVLNTITNANPDYLWSASYYDDEGRNIKTYKQHYLGGTVSPYNYDEIASTYNFNDQVTAANRKHYTKNAGGTAAVLAITISNRYVYDHMGRKTDTFEKIDTTTEVLLADNDYNEIGQLKAKHLHSIDNGTTFKQDIGYAYNERGWLSMINDPAVAPTATKLFTEQLNYKTPKYGAPAQFNGNIAEQAYRVYNSATTGIQTVKYAYDKMNRLTDGTGSSGFSETGISYDQMGNINTLIRATAPNVATLGYTYTGNQLTVVTKGGAAFRSYGYDGNGNATSDGQGNSITYNLLNLPQAIPAKTLSYVYDAAGNKLRKISGANTTEYISGIQYTGANIDFVQTDEGRAIKSGANYNYEYTLTDHLGNNRVTFDQTSGKVGEDDYYPFGLNVHRLANAGNKYLYNKKELQDELGQYDYGARFYDPVIARWTTVDPLAEKSRRFSPYTYGENNPIRNIDPDGMATQDCCGFMGPMAGVSAYLAYVDLKQKVQSVFGLKTYAQGAVDKVNNTINKHDPGYNEHVPEKARAIHDKLMDDRADAKALIGAIEWGSANMSGITTVMGMLQGPIGNSLGTPQGPIDGYAGNNILKTEIQSIETKNPFDLEATHGLTLSKRNFNLLLEDIKTNGIQESIKYVENNGTNSVVDGHHRLMVAKRLGLKQVPVKKVQLPYGGYKTKDDLIYSRY